MKKIILFFSLVILLSQGLFAQGGFIGMKKKVILSLMKHPPMDVGIAIIHVEKKDTMLFNNNIKYPMQSVYKFPLALAVMNKVEKGKYKLDDKIKSKDSIAMLSYLLEKTVRESDNNTCDILFNKIVSPKKVNAYVKSLGVKGIEIINTEKQMHENVDLAYDNYCYPLSMTELLYKTFFTENLNQETKIYLKSIMNGKSPSRLGKYLPENVYLWHKSGTGPKNPNGVVMAVNDVGVMEIDENNHIIISVFMKNISLDYPLAEDLIGKIGQIVYDYYKPTK